MTAPKECCDNCGFQIVKTRQWQKYCSPSCRTRLWQTTYRRKRPTRLTMVAKEPRLGLTLNGEYAYFIQSSTGYIKIGKSANPIKRLQYLQTGSPEELRLLGFTKASTEEQLHASLSQYRVRGEWFRPAGPVLRAALDASLYAEAQAGVTYTGFFTSPQAFSEATRAAPGVA